MKNIRNNTSLYVALLIPASVILFLFLIFKPLKIYHQKLSNIKKQQAMTYRLNQNRKKLKQLATLYKTLAAKHYPLSQLLNKHLENKTETIRLASKLKLSHLSPTRISPTQNNQLDIFTISCTGNYFALLTFINQLLQSSHPFYLTQATLKKNNYLLIVRMLRV